MDCRRGSMIKLHGLMRIKILRSAHFCWLDTTWEQRCWPPMKLSSVTAGAVVNFDKEDVERAKYKNKQGSVWCDHWNSCCKVICMCWIARQHPVAYWSPTAIYLGPFRQHQSNDRLWDNYRRLHCSSDCILAYYVRSCKCFCELGLCPASNAHVRCVFVHDTVRSLGAAIIARSPILRSILRYRLIDMNHNFLCWPHFVTNPTLWQLGFNLPRHMWLAKPMQMGLTYCHAVCHSYEGFCRFLCR